MAESKCAAATPKPGRKLVLKLTKMFSEDNLTSLRYLYSVPQGRGGTACDLFTYLEEQGVFSPSRPSTIKPFLEAVERFDMLGVAEEWLALQGYGNTPVEASAEGCIRDALQFLDRMDEKIQDASKSDNLTEVTQNHIPCLREFLETAKMLVGRCRDHLPSTAIPIYAEIAPSSEYYSYVSSSSAELSGGRISRDALHQVPANQPQQRQQQQQQQKKAKPPPVAPKPNRKFSSTSTLSDTSDYSDCSGNVTGGDSGFCDRKQWVNSAKIEVPKPLQEFRDDTKTGYTKLVAAPSRESNYDNLRGSTYELYQRNS